MEQYGVLGLQFVLQVILARILAPEIYGMVAIVCIFIGFSNVFIQRGFSTALVQRKAIGKKDVSSVFYCSLMIATVLYAILYFCAPLVAEFFKMPELEKLLRIMCLSLFPGVYSSIQNALLRRDLNFKVVFLASTISVCISGGIAIWMAYHGFGVWALAFQQLIYSFLVVVVQFCFCRWVPMLYFSLSRVSYFWSFGWKVLVTGFIDELFVEVRAFVIGKMYTARDLSFFNRGKQFPQLLMNSINGSLQAVLLPRFSSMQDDKEKIRSTLKSSISIIYFILLPLLVILACCAQPLISVLLTDKWLPCVPYLQLYCLFYACWPFCTSCMQAIYAISRSDVVLKVEVIRKVFDATALLISVFYGVFWIAIGAVVVELISMPLYIYPSRKLLNYSLRAQIKELLPAVVISAVMAAIMLVIGRLDFSPIVILVGQVSIGLIVYVSLSLVFQKKLSNTLLNMLKGLRKSNKEAEEGNS